MTFLERAITDGHAKLSGEGNQQAVPAPNVGRRNFSLSASTGERAGVRCRRPQFPKPEEYRFYKGDPNNDIQPVSKEALIGAIKKLDDCFVVSAQTQTLKSLSKPGNNHE